MFDSSELRSMIVVFIVIAIWIMQGLRMLIKPASIRENSMMYRYIYERFFRHWNKNVKKTGKLSRKNIQIYGLILVFLGLLFLGIALTMV